MLFRRRKKLPPSPNRQPLDYWTRQKVLKRDKYRCRYCDAPAEHVDHVYPRFYGGSNHQKNLVAACARCNYAKSARILPGKSVEDQVKTFRKERLQVVRPRKSFGKRLFLAFVPFK